MASGLRHRIIAPLISSLGLAGYFGCVPVHGGEAEAGGPRICVVAPLGIPAGTNSTLQIRGLKLSGATAITIRGSTVALPATIKEKKTVEVPTGLEAKNIGDSLAIVEVTVPSELAGTELRVSLVTVEGTTGERPIRVLKTAALMEEKEPNDGFRDAQPLILGQPVAGAIGKDRDVDVFTITGHARKTLVAEILAARAGSLLDGILTLYTENGRVLAANDDVGGSRDPRLRVQFPADGTYFLTLQDASDHGTPWHAYELTAHEEP